MGVDRLVDLVEQARFNKIPLHMAAFRNVVQVNGIAVLGIYIYIAKLYGLGRVANHYTHQKCLQMFALSL